MAHPTAIPRTSSYGSDDSEKTLGGTQVARGAEKPKVSEDGSSDTRVEAQAAAVETYEEPYIPDGGWRAWLVVLGGALGNGATFGYVNAWGIFQSYYEETLLKDTPPSTIAWIGSIQYAFTFIPGLFMGQLFDRGHLKIPLAIASILLVVFTLLVAQCTEYWQFLLCQGFAVGLASGATFGPLVAAVSHWFKRRKGLALALMSFGTSTCGALFPVAVDNLIKRVGFQWTMRILALILLCMLTATTLLVSRRLPPAKHPRPIFDFHQFKTPAFSMYCASGFVSFLGLYTFLTYINVSATAVGIDSNFAAYLVSIANAGSAGGRVVMMILSDRLGPLTMMAPAAFLAGITTLIWPFIRTKGAFIVLGIINGIFVGIFASVLGAPPIAMGPLDTVGVRVGMFFSVIALGAVAGPPISGAINTATGGFYAVGYYASAVIFLSVGMFWYTRHLVLGGKLRGKA